MAEDPKQLKWKDLDGQERYRVVELIRKQEVQIQDLCKTFGVSRQTLHRAVAAADEAAVDALGMPDTPPHDVEASATGGGAGAGGRSGTPGRFSMAQLRTGLADAAAAAAKVVTKAAAAGAAGSVP